MLESKTDYTFRIRLNRTYEHTININETTYEIKIKNDTINYNLKSNDSKPIKDSTSWVFYGSGYKSEKEAKENGERFLKIIFLVLTKLKVGAEFGLLSYDSKFNSFGRLLFPNQRNPRYLDDLLGLSIYETEPEPEFKLTPVKTIIGTPSAKLDEAFSWATDKSNKVTEKRRIACELFLSSYFYQSITTRFIILIIAIESLLEPKYRADSTKKFLHKIIRRFKRENSIIKSDKDSIINVLYNLKKESIGKTGKDFATFVLGQNKYLDLTPAQFFKRCYDLRGKIVHRGITTKDRVEVKALIGNLENFVSDLLCGL